MPESRFGSSYTHTHGGNSRARAKQGTFLQTAIYQLSHTPPAFAVPLIHSFTGFLLQQTPPPIPRAIIFVLCRRYYTYTQTDRQPLAQTGIE